MRRNVFLQVIIIVASLCLTSCDRQVPNEQIVTLSSIAVSPESPQPLPIGSVQDFKAIGKYSDSSTRDITEQVTWASSNEPVASMAQYGGALACKEGTTQITAVLDGIVSPAVLLSVPSIDTSILIYLDSGYTKLWDSTNKPDISVLHWEPDTSESSSPYSWERGVLTVYLWNTGAIPLKVNAEGNINAAYPGFSTRSDTVTINPDERIALDITIMRSPLVLGMTGTSKFSVWFNIRK